MRKIFKKNRIKPLRVFDENNLSSLPRIILSSALVILFFYSLPIVINFTSNKIESSAGIQNNSKAILAYTLNKKSSNVTSDHCFIFSSINISTRNFECTDTCTTCMKHSIYNFKAWTFVYRIITSVTWWTKRCVLIIFPVSEFRIQVNLNFEIC